MAGVLAVATAAVACLGSALPAAANADQPLAASQIATGAFHTCAIQKSTNRVVCWGRKDLGEAVVPDSLGQAIEITAGYGQTCAIRRQARTVACWGHAPVREIGRAHV